MLLLLLLLGPMLLLFLRIRPGCMRRLLRLRLLLLADAPLRWTGPLVLINLARLLLLFVLLLFVITRLYFVNLRIRGGPRGLRWALYHLLLLLLA